MSKNWKNWAETVNIQVEDILKPSSEEEMRMIIQQANQNKKTIRMVGNGHSFSDLIKTNSLLVSMDNWSGLLDVDSKNKIARIKSGSNIKTVGEWLFDNGLAQENLGDIDVQSIAGAFSTGTHGTGISFGTLSTQIKQLTFINGLGQKITCSEEENKEIFKAAQVSLGALGMITEYEIQCQEKYVLELKNIKGNLYNCLENLEKYKSENRNFEFYYFPFTDIVQMKFSNITDKEAKSGGIGQYLNDIILENGALKVVSEISRIFPSQSRRVSKLCGALVGESQRCTWSHQVFATARWVKFTEMEYNIPTEHFSDCLLEIKEKIEAEHYDLHFPIECRFVKQDDIYLSPAYQRDSAYIAVHMYKGMPHEKYFNDIENIFKKYNGRPHWGKMHTRTANDLKELYPKWNDFLKIRKEMDPNGIFLNPHLKELFSIDV